MIITSFINLVSEAEEIQEYTDTVPSDNPDEIIERIKRLGVYISRTGVMLADAKYHLSDKRKLDVMKVIEDILLEAKVSAKVQNALIDSLCKEEQRLVDQIERLNRTCTHQQEAMRSILSFERENLRISKTGY